MHTTVLFLSSLWLLVSVLEALDSDKMDSLLSLYKLDRAVRYDDINASLSWSLIPNALEIEFQLIAPISNKNSWISLGISDTSGMVGNDIALFTWKNDNKIYDLYSNSFDTPILDTIQDWKFLNAKLHELSNLKLLILFFFLNCF